MSGSRGRSLALICAYYFLLKGTVNVLFISSQTLFFRSAGVTGLPYVYTALNIVYIALQAALIQRLKARSALYLSRISWLFAGLLTLRVALGATTGTVAATVFLLLVMVYDLFFNQFFMHYLNEVFPLQVGKTNLPIVTAAGSLAFILSGLGLKLALSFVGLAGAMAAALVSFLGCLALFAAVRRTWGDGDSEEPAPATPVQPDASASTGLQGTWNQLPELGRLVVTGGFLTMAGKYWLDYQYSRAITVAFPGEKELASFIAVYTSGTDLLVLASQMTLAGKMLARMRLATSLAVMPVALLFASALTLATGSPLTVLVTQFLFTYLSKTLHNSAAALILPVLPSADRLRTMGLSGIASSAGCLLVGLALIGVQGRLTTASAFALLTVCFGLLLAVILRMGAATSRALVAALASASGERREEALLSFSLLDPAERVRQLERLLESAESADRGRALELVSPLAAPSVASLLVPYLKRETDPRLLATAARVLAGSADLEGRPKVRELLADEGCDDRVRANILDALPRAPDAIFLLPSVVPLLDHDHHRVAAAAAAATLKLATNPGWIEAALRRLQEMLADRSSPLRRSAAFVALGSLRDAAFLPDLAVGLADGDENVARLALGALAGIDDPRVAPVLRRYLESGPPEALEGPARRHLDHVGRLAIHSVSQVLDSLTEGERLQAAGYLSRARDDAKSRLFLRALALAETGPRRAFCVFLDGCDDSEWLALLERGLTGGAAASELNFAQIAEGLRSGTWVGFGPLQQLAEALLGNGERGLADSLLSAALGRLWIERACLERPELPAGRRDELEARVAGRVAHASRIAASRCARPARVLDALDRLPGGDRFVSSLAVEYLASELPGELKDLLLPLLEASGASRFASRSRCWLDTTALGIPRVMALLGETDAYCSQA